MPCDALLKGADSVWCRKKEEENTPAHIYCIFSTFFEKDAFDQPITSATCCILRRSKITSPTRQILKTSNRSWKCTPLFGGWALQRTCFLKKPQCIIVISSAHKASIIAVIQTQKTKPSYAFQNSLQEDPEKRNRGACLDHSVLSLSCWAS